MMTKGYVFAIPNEPETFGIYYKGMAEERVAIVFSTRLHASGVVDDLLVLHAGRFEAVPEWDARLPGMLAYYRRQQETTNL